MRCNLKKEGLFNNNTAGTEDSCQFGPASECSGTLRILHVEVQERSDRLAGLPGTYRSCFGDVMFSEGHIDETTKTQSYNTRKT